MTIIHKLKWRYATKHFEAGKIIPEEDITQLLEATRLSASALGLQPYKFLVIKNHDLKKELAKYSFHGIDVANASHLIVFASMNEVSDEYIKETIRMTEEIRALEPGSLKDLEDLSIKLIRAKSPEELKQWSQKQSYVALATLILAAADMKIDMCPMEVIDHEAYNQILGLDKENLHATVVGVLGYRKHNDPDQFLKKSRRALNDLVKLYY